MVRGARSSGLSRGYRHEGSLLSLPHLSERALRDMDLSPVRLARGDGVLSVFPPTRRGQRRFLPSSLSGTGAPALSMVRLAAVSPLRPCVPGSAPPEGRRGHRNDI